MSLYDAVKLASEQPPVSNASCRQQKCARAGPQYYIFGAPGSNACAIAAHDRGRVPVPGFHCLLVGPEQPGPNESKPTILNGLYSLLPTGVQKSQAQVLVVPQGTVILQATSPKFSLSGSVPFSSPAAPAIRP